MSDEIGNITYREHYEAVARQKGELPDPLKKDPPAMFRYLWSWFTELHSSRGEGGIPYSEIQAWAELTGRTLSVFEVKAIKQIDQKYLEHRSEQLNKKRNGH